MAEPTHWAFPDALQPDSDALRFDLGQALQSAVMLRTEVPDDAFTAGILGTERIGNGMVIRDDGLILTIGYLVTEAQTVWITDHRDRAVEGYPLAYDFATGFGLVQALGKLDAPALRLGNPDHTRIDDEVVVLAHGGRIHTLQAKLTGRREFAGYWEYLLDSALYTTPAHPQWGGTGLLNAEGELIGIGSLLVQESADGRNTQGNMFVPVNLLEPILEDMVRYGRPRRPVRPWLGMYTTESDGQLVVAGLAPGGPAERAGILQGDLVLEVASDRVNTLAALLRRVWTLGAAGVDVPLTLARDGAVVRVTLKSADRADMLKKPLLH
jgi:S1-C subfamily serine protease